MNRLSSLRWLRLIVPGLGMALASLFILTPRSLASPAAASQPAPALTVDAAAANHPINPDIYGMNRADPALIAELQLPVNRWGGNDTTRYNYLNDISNHASDWYFENILEGSGANLPDGSTVNQFIGTNNAADTRTLLTVPTIGYVPNNDATACGFSVTKYAAQGPQTGVDSWRPDCGTGVLSGGGNVTGNDPLDTSIVANPAFVGAWVSYLHARYGGSAPEYYALDNEPDLWFETHRDVHPAGAGYDELFSRGRDYAAAIKAADPGAKVFGPVAWGWTGYFYSAQDIADGLPYWDFPSPSGSDRALHGDIPFLEWYLQQMAAYEAAHSTRLLDYLDIHFYPQTGVDLRPAGSAALKAKRLRGTRSLWDPTYLEQTDGSWIDQPVMLIPRMRSWVNDNYPGTKLAITEYNWGGLEDINGALAQADILGIFGREQLDLATLWDPPAPAQPGAYAFRMYLNYDGSGGHFGDTSVQASSADQSQLAIYGSTDSGTGALKLMVINKTAKTLSSSISLDNFDPATCAAVYTYSSANRSAIVQSWQPVSSGGLSKAFPGQSITLLVIPPSTTPCGAPASALLPPALSSPRQAGAVYTPTPMLSWRGVNGATGYHLLLDDSPDFSSPLVDSVALKTVFISPPLDYGTYSWQVLAAAPDGLTDYSAPSTFDVTVMVSPKRGLVTRTTMPTFKWKAVPGASLYHLEVFEDAPGGSLAFEQNDLAALSFKTTAPLAPGLYYWQISADNGAVMPAWPFTVTP